MIQLTSGTDKTLQLTQKWRQEVQHNRVKMEFYRGLLRSGFGKMTESKLENACFLYGKLQKLKERNRKLYRSILELQNGNKYKKRELGEFVAK